MRGDKEGDCHHRALEARTHTHKKKRVATTKVFPPSASKVLVGPNLSVGGASGEWDERRRRDEEEDGGRRVVKDKTVRDAVRPSSTSHLDHRGRKRKLKWMCQAVGFFLHVTAKKKMQLNFCQPAKKGQKSGGDGGQEQGKGFLHSGISNFILETFRKRKKENPSQSVNLQRRRLFEIGR